MRSTFKFMTAFFIFASLGLGAYGQALNWQPDLTRQQTYTLERSSSSDPTGGNADSRSVAPGETFTVLDTDGPGMISHIWFTISDNERYHLKRIVLRMYWDNETSPSVETPIGDFFGQGLGEYHNWHSEMLSVASAKALNCFFPMPFARHARITVTNEGTEPIHVAVLQHRLPELLRSPCCRHPLFPRPVPSSPAQSWLDLEWWQWRSAGQRSSPI